MKDIKVYSTPTCHFCKLAKEFMQSHGIKYTEYNVATDLEKRKEMVEKSRQMGVPVFDIDGDISVGYDEEEFARMVGVAK